MKRIALIFILLLTGCSITYHHAEPLPSNIQQAQTSPPDIIVLSKETAYGGKYWLAEARKRFPNPIVVIGHGEEFKNQKPEDKIPFWFQKSPAGTITVSTLARALHHCFPDRDIVLVICNPDGHSLDVDRVWYAKTNVWVVPDSYVEGLVAKGSPLFAITRETTIGVGNVGNISEFITKNDTKTITAHLPQMPAK